MSHDRVQRRLEVIRAAVQAGDFEQAERLEAQLHAECLEYLATTARSGTRAATQLRSLASLASLALQSRELWLEP